MSTTKDSQTTEKEILPRETPHHELAHTDTVDSSAEETRGFALQRTDDNEEPTLHLRTGLIVAALCFASFAINLGVTGSGFWMSYVVGTLGPSPFANFFAVGWLVLQVGITPIFGQMSDFGPPTRKWITVILMMVAVIGLFVAASATTWNVAIFGMTLFGPAVFTYGPQAAIASDCIPRRMRGIIQGLLYASQACGSLLASVGGGALIRDNVGGAGGWRWILYLGAILMTIAAFGILVLYRPIPRPELNEKPYLKRVLELDWVGTILFDIGMVPFLCGILLGGNRYPWDHAAVIACLVIGCSFFVIFALHQAFIKKDGIFNHRLFKNRNLAISLAVIFVEGVVYITLNTFLGQQIFSLYEQRPIVVGLHFTVLLICAGTSACLAGYYSHKTKEMRYPLLIGYFLFICAIIGFSQADADQSSDKVIYGMCALVGIGFGPPLALVLAVAQLAVDPDMTGIASSLVIGIRSWGGATGASIAGAIFTNKIQKYLPEKIAARALAAGATAAQIPSIIGFVGDQTGTVKPPAGVSQEILAAAVRGLREAYAKSFSFVYYEILPWAVVAFILLCFLRPTHHAMTWSITTPAEDYDKLGVHRAVAVPGNETYKD